MDGYTLITGATGSGKSLFAVDLLRSEFFKNRPLFVSGVPGLKLPHQKLDPNELEEGGDLLEEREIVPLVDLPVKSVVFIDECQRVFPPRASTKTPPANVRYFEVRRKLAHDGLLVTQHPNLLDPNVRKLVNRHIHVVRTLGMQRATIYEWTKCKDPDSKNDMKAALTRKYVYPRDVYKLYKSAEIHTVKPRIPKTVFLIPLFLILAVVLGYMGYMRTQSKAHEMAGQEGASAAGVTNSTPAGKGDSKEAYLDPVADAKKFVFNSTPRVEGFTHTAPKYDGITAPTSAPMPVACVQSARGCNCYSQQATRMETTPAQCVAIVEHGYFQDFDPQANKNMDIKHSEPSKSPLQAETPSNPVRVFGGDGDGYGVLGRRRS